MLTFPSTLNSPALRPKVMTDSTSGHVRSAVAALACSAAGVLLVYCSPILQTRGMLPLLLGVVAVATWLGGWRAGVLTTVVAAAVAAWYLQPLGLAISDSNDVIRLLIFVAVAAIISFLHNSRERAVEQSQRARDRLTSALAAARMGAWESDLRTGEFWWSDYLEDLFGRRPGSFSPTYDEFLGYIHPEDREFVEHAVTRSAGAGAEFEVEHRIVRPDRAVRYIITRGRIIQDDEGNATRVVGVAVDITDRKSTDELKADAKADSEDRSVSARSGRL